MSCSPVRCPGTKNSAGTQHASWVTRPDNPSARRYYCHRCEAFYAHVVDVRTGETHPETD